MDNQAAVITFLASTMLLATVSSPVEAKEKARTVRESVGVNIHFTNPDPGVMDMLADSGMGWVRMDLAWAATERVKGVYNFSHYDTLLTNLDKKNMRAMLILDYGSDIYGASGKPPYDDVGRAAFARWAVAAVDHFKNRHVLWELWNEPNGDWFWPKHNAGDYSKLNQVVGKAIKERFPNELFIGPATSGFDTAYLEQCFQNGCLEYWNGVSVHPYRQTNPETASPDYDTLRKLIDKYSKGRQIPIISGEWGYSVQWSGFNDEHQARYAARQLLTNMENNIPLSIWYDWHDDGNNSNDPECNFGLVRWEYHAGRTPVYDPKPSYIAVRSLTSALGDFTFKQRLPIGDSSADHIDTYTKRKATWYAVWTTSATKHSITLPVKPGNYEIIDYLGKSRPVPAGKAGLTLLISDTPVYVVPY